jgi:hypothetical protein
MVFRTEALKKKLMALTRIFFMHMEDLDIRRCYDAGLKPCLSKSSCLSRSFI